MKLLTIFPSTIRGGSEEYALTIAKAASGIGWEVHAAFPQTEGTDSVMKDFELAKITYHELDIVAVEGKKWKLFREHIPHFSRSISLLKKISPNVVHVNVPWPYSCFDTLLACGFLNIPTVVSFHLFPRYFSYSQVRLKAYQWFHRRNQTWIAISENNRNFISQSFKIPKEELALIYNGTKINSEFINYSSEQKTKLHYELCQELGLNSDDIILLTVGRLDAQKGYQDLVQVVSPIIEQFPNAKFVWVGEGNKREYLTKQINQYNINDNVLLLGYRKDVPRLMKAADLFVFPTYFEGGQSLAIGEAMAYGLPIVTSDASGIPEIIKDKVYGLLFPKGDKEELKKAILWSCKNPKGMQEMAKKAVTRVQDFSQWKMISQTLKVLEDMGSIHH